MRDIGRDFVVEALAAESVVLVIDGTGFLKQGKTLAVSCVNTPVGGQNHRLPILRLSRLCLAPRSCLIDRALYLSKVWASDSARMDAAALVVNRGTAGLLRRWRRMFVEPACVFAFQEPDHLTRIHLKLALEDAGFAVFEEADTIALRDTPDAATQGPVGS
jgi:hypothetical protein